MSKNKEPVSERMDKYSEAFEYLWWDYHSRFHKDDGNTGGHKACVEWPCVYIANALRQ